MRTESYGVSAFLGHEGPATQEAGSHPVREWDNRMAVPARAHLLDRWLADDTARPPALHTDRRHGDAADGLNVPVLVAHGLFPLIDPARRLNREPLASRSVPVEEVAGLVHSAVLSSVERMSPRVKLMLEELNEAIVDSDPAEAALVTVVDPDTGEAVDGEVHAVLSFGDELIRVSVVAPGADQVRVAADPACSFAGHWCDRGHPLAPDEHDMAEARLRAVCAGTVLQALLGCEGHAAFKVGWTRHGLSPGARGENALDSVRTWWGETPWNHEYVDDLFTHYDSHADGQNTPVSDEEFDELSDTAAWVEKECVSLGGPTASSRSGPWTLNDGMHLLQIAGFSEEVAHLRTAAHDTAVSAVGAARAALAPELLDELVSAPIERIGGAEGHLMLWADADTDGRFWRSPDGEVDVYDDPRRLLAVGATEALYLRFQGETGA